MEGPRHQRTSQGSDGMENDRRRGWLRKWLISTVVILVMIVVGALAFVWNESSREERREQIVNELNASGATLTPFPPRTPPPVSWRRQWGAWLRGKSPVVAYESVAFVKGSTLVEMRDFAEYFPDTRMVSLRDASEATLDFWVSRGPFDWFSISDIDSLDSRAIERISRIRCDKGVYLEPKVLTNAALEAIADKGANVRIPGWHEPWREVTDAGLRAVPRIPHCKVVYASCRATDAGVNSLANDPKIETLTIQGVQYTDDSARVIPTLKSLHAVRFVSTSHTDVGLAQAIEDCAASTIELDRVAVGSATIAALRKAPHLVSLRLRGTTLTPDQCDEIAQLRVRTLDIEDTTFTNHHGARLAPLATRLVEFSLRSPGVTDDGLQWLRHARRLESVDLGYTGATIATWRLLVNSRNLYHVEMGSTSLDSEFAVTLRQLPALRSVTLVGEGISDSNLPHWPDLPLYLALRNTHVTATGLRVFLSRCEHKSRMPISIEILYEGDRLGLITRDEAKFIAPSPGALYWCGVSYLKQLACE